MNSSGYIYIIKTRECIRMKENIYKIGRTEDIIQRMKQYSKGSKLIYTVFTDNVIAKEGKLRFLLRDYVKKELGFEYIEYNINLLKELIDKEVNIIDNTLTMDSLNEPNILVRNEKSNIYKIFVEDKIKQSSNISSLNINELYEEFKYWCKEQSVREKIPNKVDFRKNISDML